MARPQMVVRTDSAGRIPLAEAVKLSSWHQILIAAAIALGATLCVRALVLLGRGGGLRQAAMASCAAVATVAGAIYLRRFRRKLAPRAPSSGGED